MAAPRPCRPGQSRVCPQALGQPKDRLPAKAVPLRMPLGRGADPGLHEQVDRAENRVAQIFDIQIVVLLPCGQQGSEIEWVRHGSLTISGVWPRSGSRQAAKGKPGRREQKQQPGGNRPLFGATAFFDFTSRTGKCIA